MLSGVGCVAKRSGDVGVFGVPEDAGHGGFQGDEEEQEKVIEVRHGRGCQRLGWMLRWMTQRLWPGDSGRRRVVAVMIGKSGPSLLFELRSMDHVFDVVWLLVSGFVR